MGAAVHTEGMVGSALAARAGWIGHVNMIHCEAEGSALLERAAVRLREVLSEQHHSRRCVHRHAAPDLPWGSAGGRDESVGPQRDD